MVNYLDGKVVVITGGSSGIGEAIARHLGAMGANISLAARRIEKLEEITSDIKNCGGKACFFKTDIRNRYQVQDLVSETIKFYGKVDVFINNAGIMPLSALEELQFEQWDDMIDTNIKGVLYGIGAILPHMKTRKTGHIITIASVAGHRVPIGSGSAVYSATKFAVRTISEGLRQEVKPYNIRTTLISPGAIKTELPNTVTDPKIKAVMQKTVFDIAISPQAVANAVAYAMQQPDDCDVNEILLRPTAQVT